MKTKFDAQQEIAKLRSEIDQIKADFIAQVIGPDALVERVRAIVAELKPKRTVISPEEIARRTAIRLERGDRNARILACREEHPDWTSNAIADACDVSRPTAFHVLRVAGKQKREKPSGPVCVNPVVTPEEQVASDKAFGMAGQGHRCPVEEPPEVKAPRKAKAPKKSARKAAPKSKLAETAHVAKT